MLKIRFKLAVTLITLTLLTATYPILADAVWIGKDSDAKKCCDMDGRTLAQDQAALMDLGITPARGCRGTIVGLVTCDACCVCSAGIFNFFLVDEADLPTAQEAGWGRVEASELIFTQCLEK